MNQTINKQLTKMLTALPAAALLLAVFAGSLLQPEKAWSDDRDLLGASSDNPYVFFILDTGSSMRRWWGTVGTGGSEPGAWVPMTVDDPNSKLYIAKKAIYEVVEEVGDNTNFGFATLDQFMINIEEKNWMYTLESNPSWLARPDFAGGSATNPWLGPGTANVAYPRVGHPLRFGENLFGGAGISEDREDPARVGGDNMDGSCQYPEDLDVAVAQPVRGLGGGASPANRNAERMTDTRALGQLWTFSKLDRDGQSLTIQWFKFKGEKYRLIWYPLTGGQQLGDVPLTIKVDFQRLSNGNCSSPAYEDIAIDETLTLVPLYPEDLDGDPILTDPTVFVSNASREIGFFQQRQHTFGGACATSGNRSEPGHGEIYWNPSHDDIGDQWTYDVIADPLGRGPAFDRGDMIPFDWTNPGYAVGNREEIMRRLAPSIILGEPPDFRVARYLKDFADRDLVTGAFTLKDEFVDYPPILTATDTPLAGAMAAFRVWFDEWVVLGQNHGGTGECGGVHVVLLTDGIEECASEYPGSVIGTKFCEGASLSCPGNNREAPPTQADILLNANYPAGHPLAALVRGIKTHVLAFDMSSFNQVAIDSVNDIAEKGGTCADRNGDTIVDPDTECAHFAFDKDQMVDALRSIVAGIRAEARSFVPAATSPRTFNAEEKIVLSNFLPVPGESTWDGHMNAFLKPLPLTSDGRPDTSIICNGTTVTEACFLWDAGEELEAQAPTEGDVNSTPSLLNIGAAAEERRVFYAQEPLFSETVPLPRRLFAFNDSTTAAEWVDLLNGLELDATEVERGKDIIRNTLKIKQATIPDPDGSTIEVEIQYVLGDVFHSDPAVVGIPNEGRFFQSDLFSTDAFDCTDNPGYRCYFEKHQFRRQVLAAGANDGQAHFFDLARFEYTTDPAEDGEYNNGTGRELFSYIPRGVLPNVRDQAEIQNYGWDVDSPLRVADVFIDPAHDGIPTPEDREWRTLAMGGLRRGGRLYYALDMTQPDKLDTKNVGVPLNGYVPSCWNEGGTADCGPLPYGSALWEFTDTWDEDTAEQSGHGNPDLGDTWSIPNTGMIRVLENDGTDDVEVFKFVAVFGGGLDPSMAGNLGNWLYMVDIETGQTIYKRRLSSSAASEPAAVDTDQNGFIDTIYIGTTDGFLYKADVGEPKLLDPTATVTEHSTGSPVVRTVNRVIDEAWDPFIVFDTGGRPIFFPPSVIFVAKLGQYALSFGTGDREDVLATTNQVARFYTILDDGFAVDDTRLPLDESDLTVIEFDSVFEQTDDLLVNPPFGFEAGWVLTLTPNEKVVTKALAFAGILTFSSFSPEITDSTVCGGAGSGKIFIVNTTNGNPVHDLSGAGTRFFDVSDIVTNPYVEPGGMPGDDDDDDGGGNPCAGHLALTRKLMQLFPSSCKFANRTENIMTQRADTGVQCIAPVPVCIDQKNWKEF